MRYEWGFGGEWREGEIRKKMEEEEEEEKEEEEEEEKGLTQLLPLRR